MAYDTDYEQSCLEKGETAPRSQEETREIVNAWRLWWRSSGNAAYWDSVEDIEKELRGD